MNISLTFTDEIVVEVLQQMGSDQMIAQAARVATQSIIKGVTIPDKEVEGLINYLIKHRHGTPFEHSAVTFFVHAPIFVWREHHRHRIGFSYNEQSARYQQLQPIFWIPKRERKIVPVPDPGPTCPTCSFELVKSEAGRKSCPSCKKEYRYHTSARPCFGPIKDELDFEKLRWNLEESYTASYKSYENMLNKDIAKEVARAVLPVGIYSSCWVTCNPRSLMHFLSLRVHNPEALFVSYPQAEIEIVARCYEKMLSEGWPITHKAFIDNKWVAP